ncbi:hypothetical protein [Ornithinibacillus halophilus]|uniref:Histone deacetylase n=1 Tax=Ornithinibacillus halophilus TaxID=930117 RepID=A0A1M5MCH0_9BACI|nr:hypothetical protein [Ornithinibacillus halophilus]SHG74966.1 hypothetical protein SAMN05216225_10578 [Ornithinibacillus halophilus]
MKVWYASYGSNISEDRFLCYITGDTPPGSTKAERGCRDNTRPMDSAEVNMPYPLYFAKKRSKWGEGGVAFIDHKKSEAANATVGKMYLITDEQFADVVAQENNQSTMDIDLEKVIRNGHLKIRPGWYGRIIYLGEENGYPIFTFTNNEPMNVQELNKPAIPYIRTIANGMLDLGYDQQQVVDYFLTKNGIVGEFSEETLWSYIFDE